MRRVLREELLDYMTYEDRRSEIRERVLAEKARRRIHVGAHLTFLFENHDTVRYQVQEMMRVERIVREADIVHELETYNELIGGPGELGCTLLIEIDDPETRSEKLQTWRDLPAHIFAVLEDGTRVAARYDPRQVGEERLSAVQYLKFETGGRIPQRLEVTHPALEASLDLDDEQKRALAEDLSS